MRYNKIDEYEICNGSGEGVSLFVQGCPHQCEGCFNPETWDFDGGEFFSFKTRDKLLDLLNKPYINRFTILGGEPLCEENVLDLYNLLFLIRPMFPDLKIWIYTGYTFEDLLWIDPESPYGQIIEKILTDYVDYLVDGPYIESLRDLTLPFRGSSNQRIIDTKKSFEYTNIVLK